MRADLDSGLMAVWRLWKRLTAWFGVVPIDRVDQAMDRGTRSGAPWRYHVWFFAWIVAFVAYIPVGMVVAFSLSGNNTPMASLAIFGPMAVLSVLVSYYGMRHWLCAARIPAAGSVAAISDQTGSRTKKKSPGSLVHPQEESGGPARASSHAWRWIGAVLVIVSVVGRFATHH